jgi:hypothetical protein
MTKLKADGDSLSIQDRNDLARTFHTPGVKFVTRKEAERETAEEALKNSETNQSEAGNQEGMNQTRLAGYARLADCSRFPGFRLKARIFLRKKPSSL